MTDFSGYDRAPSSNAASPNTGRSNDLSQQAKNLGNDLKSTASSLGESVAGAVKQQASVLGEAARSVADGATEQIGSAVNEQKTSGADYVGNIAQAIHRAAGEIGKDVPQVEAYIHKAADQIDRAAQAVRERNVGQLMTEVQNFARRQPTAFFGGAVILGFAAIRFLKSSQNRLRPSQLVMRLHPTQQTPPRRVPLAADVPYPECKEPLMDHDARTISRLFGKALSQLGLLFQTEIRIARAEISEKAASAKRGAVFLGIAAVIMIPSLVTLFIAFALWLAEHGFSGPVSYLIAAVSGGLVSVVLAAVGMSCLKPKNLAPKITMQELERDIAAAKGMVK